VPSQVHPPSQKVQRWPPDNDQNNKSLCDKENVDKKNRMQYINRKDIGKALRELITKEGKSLRKTSIDFEKVLDYLGYEIKIIKKMKKQRR
jgi:hypothetical protein